MSKFPETWDEALLSADLVDPRNGKPSLNQLAIRADLPASTVTAIAAGRRKPKAGTIQKIADALGVDVRVVSAWVGQERTERAPYAPPAEADLLTDRQRRAVDEMIRAIIAERASGRHDDQENDDAPATAGGSAMEDSAQPDGITRDERRRAPRRDDFALAGDDSGPSALEADDARAAERGEESQDPEDWT